MGEIIEVRLSDAQHRQLMDEARAAGQKFFDYCRTKLTEGTLERNDRPYGVSPVTQTRPAEVKLVDRPMTVGWGKETTVASGAPTPTDARFARIEDAIAALTNVVMQQAGQPTAAQPEEPTEYTDDTIDVNDMVSRSLEDAERTGMTAVSREEASPAEGGVRHVGRRPPAPYTVGNQPKHLVGL